MKEQIEALSDAFQSTFTVIRRNPDVIANMIAPHEVEGVKELIKKHLGWAEVDAVSTGQLTPDYDVWFFARSTPNQGDVTPNEEGSG